MAYNVDQFELKEATLLYGTWSTPNAIDGDTDPETTGGWSSTGDLGYIRRGTLKYGINDEYVEYESETPAIIPAKDLLKRQVTLEFTMNQLNLTHFGLVYSMETDAGTAYDVAYVGFNIIVKQQYGFLLSGALRDGTVIKFAVWSGEFSSEDLSSNWTGDDYVDIPVMIQAFPHSTFMSTRTAAGDRAAYGAIWYPNT